MSDSVPTASLFDLLEAGHCEAEFSALREHVWGMGQEITRRMNAGVPPAEMPALTGALAATQAGIAIIEKLAASRR